MVESIFAMAKLSVEVMVLLFGTLTLWLGFLRIAEKAGIVEWLARALGPLFARLMPEVPPGHPALGLITLNFAANGLGLDNAATPIGLKAMRALQELNPSPTSASNAQILFLVLNASSLTLLPVTIFMYRAQQGAPDPTLVFLPILLATSASTLVGLLSVAVDAAPAPVGPGGAGLPDSRRADSGGLHGAAGEPVGSGAGELSSILGNLTLFGLIMLFLVIGALRKVKVYEAFVEGAKEGFDVAKNLLPIWWRCSVPWAYCAHRARWILAWTAFAIWSNGWAGTRFVDALPTAMVKPFSGSAARALLIETMQTKGVDSFPALVAATVQGSTKPPSMCWRCTSVRSASARAPCRGLRLAGRVLGRGGGDCGVLLVLRLNRVGAACLAIFDLKEDREASSLQIGSSLRLFTRLEVFGQALKPDDLRRITLNLNRLVLDPSHKRQLLVFGLHRGKAVSGIFKGDGKHRVRV
jgi:spore maturation protein SpmA/spore maturation protein SpmB